MSGFPQRKGHLTWIDAAKGVGIVLVVLGHEIAGLADSQIISWSSTAHFFYAWIYAFHMPLFFFISGLFISHSLKKSFGVFALEKVRTILYPYFLWSLITMCSKSLFPGSVNHPYGLPDLLLIFFDPIDQYWFLYVLFGLFMIFGAGLKAGMNRWVVLILAIALNPSLSPIHIPPSPPLIEAALSAIYFALGVVVSGERMSRVISDVKTRWLIVAFPAGLAIAALAGWVGATGRSYFVLIFAISGICGALALARLLDRTRLAWLFRTLGRRSLEIFVAHILATAGMRVALVKIAHVTAATPHFVLGALAGICFPLAMVWVCEAIGLELVFRLPSTPRVRPAAPSVAEARKM
jgi:fucose 4-O-acetylase-like acetyltransferase